MERIGWRGEWRVRLDDNRPAHYPQKSPNVPKRAVMIVSAATWESAMIKARNMAPHGMFVTDACCLSGYELPETKGT